MNSALNSPCIAVVGPANAGKTTLLHQLDDKLKRRLDSFLVLKGNPDGTGRYLYHAPDLRNQPEFKKSVKGKWGDATIDRICEWITHGRHNLSLALLDFGGRHDAQTGEGNSRMLQACSHYLVVSRESNVSGAAFWDDICRSAPLNLIRVGEMLSLPADGPEPAVLDSNEGIRATFRVDVHAGDSVNDAALAPLVDALMQLSQPTDRTPYINLHRPDDWRLEDIPSVAGQASKIVELVLRTGVVVVGGAAPIWAYLAALRCALDARGDARVFFFDPKQPERLVEIPALPAKSSGSQGAFPPDILRLSWREDGTLSILQFEIITPDRFLPPSAAQNLAGAPVATVPSLRDVALSGAGPTWLFGTYARWLMAGGARSLASWDGRTKSFIRVWSHGTPVLINRYSRK